MTDYVFGVVAYDVNDNVAIVHSAGRKCSANCSKLPEKRTRGKEQKC